MKRHVFFLFLFLILFYLVFKHLILNISTNLIDWRDYSYIAWVINQNITHLRNFDFQNLFNLNAFYPYTNTLFLSDTLLTQAIIGLPISYFTNNPVTIFNYIFLTTFILNYLAAYNLFLKIFQKGVIAFIGSVSLIFSAFFYTQIGHFQMQSYWPFLVVIALLLKRDDNKSFKNQVLIGVFISLQFLASVYLAFFSLITVLIFFALKCVTEFKYKANAIKFIVIVLTFLVLDGIFIKGYIDAKKSFDIQRDSGEYLVYSAKITDYIFPRQNGLFYQNKIINKWNSFNKHQSGEPASFPGLTISILALLGMFKFSRTKKGVALFFPTDFKNTFFLIVVGVGFAFSLGYPYLPFVKFIPFFDAVRGTSRWSFLVYFGMVFFALNFLSKIKPRSTVVLLALLLMIDVFPQQIHTFKDSYITANDEVLKGICSTAKIIVLEVPVTHFDAGQNIAEGLSYISKTLLATSYNKCTLVNGYSGYDLPSIQYLKNDVSMAFQDNNSRALYDSVKQSGADLVSINFESLPQSLYPNTEKVLLSLQKSGKLTLVKEGVYQIH